MAKEDISTVFAAMEKMEAFSCGTGATKQQVASLEEDLGISLPADYWEFLLKYGWAEWSGYEIFGLFNLGPGSTAADLDTVRGTLELRREEPPPDYPGEWKGIPEEGNVLAAPGEVIFLYARDSKRPGVVVELEYGDEGGEEVKSWPSFSAYVKSITKSR